MITWQTSDNSINISEYLRRLFEKANPGDGSVCFMGTKTGSPRCSQEFLSVSDLSGLQLVHLMDQMSPNDLFVSFATYKGGSHVKRDASHLANIYAWTVDVDFVNDSISPDDYFSYICENVSIPQPSFVEMGHRLRLVYVFSEPLRLCTQKQKRVMLSAFKFLQQCITRMINEELSFGGISFGAESNPPTSFVRLPGGINTKDGSTIRVIPWSEERFSLQEIFDEFIPFDMLDASRNKQEWYQAWKKKKSSKNKKKTYSGIQDLWLRRLETLKMLRTMPGVHRKKMCFIYACGLVHAGIVSTLEELLPLVMEFNEGFSNPLPYNKVYAHVKLVPNKPYKFTDRFLSEYLEVPESYFSAIPRKEYDHHRWMRKMEIMALSGETKKQKMESRLKEVISLLKEGLSQKEIAKTLSLSMSTIKRDIHLLREKGLIPDLDTVRERIRKSARLIRKGAIRIVKKILKGGVQRHRNKAAEKSEKLPWPVPRIKTSCRPRGIPEGSPP